MNRVKSKGPFLEKTILTFEKKKSDFKTFAKTSTIIPKFIGKTIDVYNGKSFTKIKIIEEMVGYKLGEFVATRKKFSYKKKK